MYSRFETVRRGGREECDYCGTWFFKSLGRPRIKKMVWGAGCEVESEPR